MATVSQHHSLKKCPSLHKDQVFALGHHDQPPHMHHEAEKPHDDPDDKQPALQVLLLKCFFLLVALGLATSTALGMWISLTRIRGRGSILVLFALGAIIPLALIVI